MGSAVFTVMAASAQTEPEIARERSTEPAAKQWVAGEDLGGRRRTSTGSRIRNARRLIEARGSVTQVVRGLGMPQAVLHRRIRELSPTAV